MRMILRTNLRGCRSWGIGRDGWGYWGRVSRSWSRSQAVSTIWLPSDSAIVWSRRRGYHFSIRGGLR